MYRRYTMKTILRSKELTCPSCVAKIESALKTLDGVAAAKVHFTTGRIEVEHDDSVVDPESLAKKVRSTGYEAQVSAF
jgi:copper chaperone CopZ